ncbi:dnaJ homolog subfamily A member 1-like [Liasis olivaceus]
MVPFRCSQFMANREKITFHQEGDQVPGFEPGDIVIVLDQKQHPIFQCRGNDLIVQREVPLVDTLCGCKQVIQTLDNRRLLVFSRPGCVIKPGDVRCIPNERMPAYRSPAQKGKLVIHFKVKFPDPGWLPLHQLRQFQSFPPTAKRSWPPKTRRR